MNVITTITRKDIISILLSQNATSFWSESKEWNLFGELTPVEFLSRLYDLDSMPSLDSRYNTAKDDIYVHTVTNPEDYSDEWPFNDSRFNLRSCKDVDFLIFLKEIFHPEVRCEASDWKWYLNQINNCLRKDGYELFIEGIISGRAIYNYRCKKDRLLNESDLSTISLTFNQAGYVLDFSNRDFSAFTENTVGFDIQAFYGGISKGKSLDAFLQEASDTLVLSLLKELLKCAQTCEKTIGNTRRELCEEILKRCSGQTQFIKNSVEDLKVKFSSEYVSQQLALMEQVQESNPTEAIGKAKEIIETCCKTILEERFIPYDSSLKFNQLYDATVKELRVTPDDIPSDIREAKTMKKILGSLRAISDGIEQLRNTYGSGHGKPASYKGLELRHAKLAIGCSLTLVDFLWASHERTKTAN